MINALKNQFKINGINPNGFLPYQSFCSELWNLKLISNCLPFSQLQSVYCSNLFVITNLSFRLPMFWVINCRTLKTERYLYCKFWCCTVCWEKNKLQCFLLNFVLSVWIINQSLNCLSKTCVWVSLSLHLFSFDFFISIVLLLSLMIEQSC
jgi:hypothetical protein